MCFEGPWRRRGWFLLLGRRKRGKTERAALLRGTRARWWRRNSPGSGQVDLLRLRPLDRAVLAAGRRTAGCSQVDVGDAVRHGRQSGGVDEFLGAVHVNGTAVGLVLCLDWCRFGC